MENKKTEEQRFKDNVINLASVIQEIMESLKNKGININPTKIKLAQVFLASMKDTDLIESFISSSYKHWPNIYKKDRSYFVKEAKNIFTAVGSEDVDAFSSLFKEDSKGNIMLNKEDENFIIDSFHAFVKISLKYIHRIRQPKKDTKGNITYTIEKFKEVDLPKEIKTWSVKIE
jgi:hypothetical protein